MSGYRRWEMESFSEVSEGVVTIMMIAQWISWLIPRSYLAQVKFQWIVVPFFMGEQGCLQGLACPPKWMVREIFISLWHSQLCCRHTVLNKCITPPPGWGLCHRSPKLIALELTQIIFVLVNTSACRNSLTEMLFLRQKYSCYCYPWIFKCIALQNWKNSKAHSYFLIEMSNYSTIPEQKN